MKIEKISENQIKCTLNRSDLAQRQIKLSELAYGTEKTQGLFQDMMEQAYEEYGFDASDLPLMIEAIPVSMDCIILMITKVEDPDEVDTNFSNFSKIGNLLQSENEDAKDEDEQENLFAPVMDAGSAPSMSMDAIKKAEALKSVAPSYERIFSFDSLNTVIAFAHSVKHISGVESLLYKDTEEKKYYLIVNRAKCAITEFALLCNAALEYGKKEPVKGAGVERVKEHCEKIIGRKALDKLAEV